MFIPMPRIFSRPRARVETCAAADAAYVPAQMKFSVLTGTQLRLPIAAAHSSGSLCKVVCDRTSPSFPPVPGAAEKINSGWVICMCLTRISVWCQSSNSFTGISSSVSTFLRSPAGSVVRTRLSRSCSATPGRYITTRKSLIFSGLFCGLSRVADGPIGLSPLDPMR